MGDLRLIASAYPGKCRVCRTPHGKGDQVWWRKGEKGVVCGSCKGQERAKIAPEHPGATTAPSSDPVALPADSGDGGNHVVRRWGSFAEYVESAKSTKPYGDEPCWYSSKKAFYGTYSWQEAINLAENGWDEIRPQVDALVEKMDAKIQPVLQPAFTSYFDVSGGMVDVGRFLDGEPECMVETKLVEIAKPGRVISILVNGSVMSVASTAEITERGCAIVALVDSLEKMQHSVEIWLEASCAQEFGGTVDEMPILTHLVKIKNAEDGLDIDELMYAIANPSRHRRLTFALRRNDPKKHQFGIPHEATSAVTMKDEIGATLILESLSYAGKTVTAEEWILNTLSEFGLVREEGE